VIRIVAELIAEIGRIILELTARCDPPLQTKTHHFLAAKRGAQSLDGARAARYSACHGMFLNMLSTLFFLRRAR
jgi:hypothetical protein